jgi:CelD/BcsL family acetyltransferase involved in cellulose biosynthesis
MIESLETPSFAVQRPLVYDLATSFAEVARLAPAWDELLERSPCHRAFSSPAWFLAACQAGPGLEPRVATAWRGSELVALLPLTQAPGSRDARFASQLADYNDLVAAPQDLAAATGLLAAVTAAPQPYDHLVLRLLRPDSNCLLGFAALALPEDSGWRLSTPPWICSYVELPASFDHYLAGRDTSFRKMLRHAERRAAANGLEVRTLGPDELAAERVPEIFLALNHSRFGARSNFAVAAAERFVRAVLPELFARRRLVLPALFQGKELIALDLCLRGADSLGAWNGGFLPEAAVWSPGRLLAAAGIRAALALGCREYDWLRGSQPYKAKWITHQRPLADLELPVLA